MYTEFRSNGSWYDKTHSIHDIHAPEDSRILYEKYGNLFSFKGLKFQSKKKMIFLIFCSKHLLWVKIRTASAIFGKKFVPLHTPVLLYNAWSKGSYSQNSQTQCKHF